MLWCCCKKQADVALSRAFNLYWSPSDIDNSLYLFVGRGGGVIPYVNPVPLAIYVGDSVVLESDSTDWYGASDVRLSMRAFSVQDAPGSTVPISCYVMPAFETIVKTSHLPAISWTWPRNWGASPGGILTTGNLAPAINKLFDTGVMDHPAADGKIRFLLYTSANLTRFPPWSPPWGGTFNYATHFITGDFAVSRS